MLTNALVAEAQSRLLRRIDQTAAEIVERFPHAADGQTGRWESRPEGAWTDGFWVGLCWLAYQLTGEPRYRTWGLEWAERLRGREKRLTHDIGFDLLIPQQRPNGVHALDRPGRISVECGQTSWRPDGTWPGGPQRTHGCFTVTSSRAASVTVTLELCPHLGYRNDDPMSFPISFPPGVLKTFPPPLRAGGGAVLLTAS